MSDLKKQQQKKPTQKPSSSQQQNGVWILKAKGYLFILQEDPKHIACLYVNQYDFKIAQTASLLILIYLV